MLHRAALGCRRACLHAGAPVAEAASAPWAAMAGWQQSRHQPEALSDDTTLSCAIGQRMRTGAAAAPDAHPHGRAALPDDGEECELDDRVGEAMVDDAVADAIVAASGVLDDAAAREAPVDICLKLALDFEYAGEAGSDKRVWFERAVKLDLAAAARIPAHHFVISALSAGRCVSARCFASADPIERRSSPYSTSSLQPLALRCIQHMRAEWRRAVPGLVRWQFSQALTCGAGDEQHRAAHPGAAGNRGW